MQKRRKKYPLCRACGCDISDLPKKDVTCSIDCQQVYRKRYKAAWYQLHKDRINPDKKYYLRDYRAKKKAEEEAEEQRKLEEAKGLELIDPEEYDDD